MQFVYTTARVLSIHEEVIFKTFGLCLRGFLPVQYALTYAQCT